MWKFPIGIWASCCFETSEELWNGRESVCLMLLEFIVEKRPHLFPLWRCVSGSDTDFLFFHSDHMAPLRWWKSVSVTQNFFTTMSNKWVNKKSHVNCHKKIQKNHIRCCWPGKESHPEKRVEGWSQERKSPILYENLQIFSFHSGKMQNVHSHWWNSTLTNKICEKSLFFSELKNLYNLPLACSGSANTLLKLNGSI